MNKQFFKKLGFSIASGMFCCGICTIFTGNVRFWAIMVSLGIFFLIFSALGTSIPFFSLGIGTSLLLFGIFILFSKNISLAIILLYIAIFIFIATGQTLSIWKFSVMIGFGINMFTSSNSGLQVFSLLLTTILFNFLLYLQETDT